MNSNSNVNSSSKNVCVYYSEKRKKFYFLHCRLDGATKSHLIYYFSPDPTDAIPLPEGYEVVVNLRTDIPFLRKKRG
jgi:hypothetical protein